MLLRRMSDDDATVEQRLVRRATVPGPKSGDQPFKRSSHGVNEGLVGIDGHVGCVGRA